MLEVQNGFAFSSKKFSSSAGMPLIRIRDLKDSGKNATRFDGAFDEAYLVSDGDLLIGMDGEFVCYQWSGGSALLNQRVCRLHGFSGDLHARFLFYGINEFLTKIEEETPYTTVKHLSSRTIKSIQFPLPPMDTQERVVAILDQAFAALDLARVHAEANLKDAGDLQDGLIANAIDHATAGGTESIKLGELCKIARGGSPRPIKKFLTTSADGINWIKISDATASGKFIKSTKERITKDGVSRSRLVTSGSFLLTNSMSFGRPYILRTEGCIHDGWLVLEPDYSKVDQDYLYYLLGSRQVFNEFDRLAAGSTVRNLNINLASSVIVMLPPLHKQREAVNRIESAVTLSTRLTDRYRDQLSDLGTLRQSLLQQAFSGQLT
ncbi:restriction endonuclease subunit S [Lysobacter sp. GX 14042]|nr:restriction endonuclease subunit S [Lysobacter sp. GX 14042]